VAADVSGLHVHGTSAEPTPGEREGSRGVQARGAPTHVPHAWGLTGARRGRSEAIPRRVVCLLWLYGSAVKFQGAGLLDPTSAALLPVATVGSAAVRGTASPRGEPRPRLEYGQVGPRAVAREPQPGTGHRPPWQLLRWPGCAASPSVLSSLTESTEPPDT
jgi:hypothetical protein